MQKGILVKFLRFSSFPSSFVPLSLPLQIYYRSIFSIKSSPSAMIAQSLKSAGRLFAVGSSQLRSFCTATSVIAEAMASEVEEDAPSAGGTSADKENSMKTMWHLYSQLSTIRNTKGKVFSVLDGYVREGRLIGKKDLLSCVRKLRTYKRHQHFLDIFEWMDMDRTKYNYSHRNHAIAQRN